jgi:hypothetical protein
MFNCNMTVSTVLRKGSGTLQNGCGRAHRRKGRKQYLFPELSAPYSFLNGELFFYTVNALDAAPAGLSGRLFEFNPAGFPLCRVFFRGGVG